ncbi:FERM domain-containing protein 5 [Teleopsis dalmanni]|uniref:FERM domain-containing protein 5 n=1 Tax=Teleopsis dalmanni TaxID=139649 RepID=UPI0018CF0C18|nr:FERM domain-containing protein 5 [Teleopsis dalmanni]
MFKNKNDCNIVYRCTVRLLEDSDVLECEFQSFHKGSYLVEYICKQLDIKENDYFGLRFVDSSKQRHWLDLAKSIIKQCKDVDPVLFSFRVKFYPADPFRLLNNGRVMLYQQLKRDLRHGRLYCSIGEAAALGSLIVQEELGDYNEDFNIGDYVSSMHLALRQTEALEKKIIELHKKREPNQRPTVAMDEFISIARGLETYGIDPYPVKDHRGSQLYIGMNYSGISTFILGKRSQHFRWGEVHKLNFESKMFIAHLSYTDASREPKKHTIGFKCVSGSACRYVWRCAIEQMLFFTLPNSQNASVVSGGGFFSWGTKFKYSGRTEREILTESINALKEQRITNSAASNRKASSVPATPSSPKVHLSQIRYSSLPRSTMSESLSSSAIEHVDNCGNIKCITNPLDGCSIQLTNLEPVSEESRLRICNANQLNNYVPDESEYYYRSSLGKNRNETDSPILYWNGSNRHYNFNDKNVVFASQPASSLSSNIVPNSSINSIATDSNVVCQNVVNCAKSVRKFHLFNVFIPSLFFVVATMAFSAVFILESDSEFLEKVRNMPEMISLRYQYYQPLKEFIFRTLSKK